MFKGDDVIKSNIVIWIGLYVLIINLIGFASMGIDKWKAKYFRYRIPEKTLLLIAMFGGSIGSFIGMQVFRHKTKHGKFIVGLPMIIVMQFAIIIYFFVKK